MAPREDEAAIKARMKRCKTIRPERMGGKGEWGGEGRGGGWWVVAATPPSEQKIEIER